MRPLSALRGRWRRSLQLRVISSTLAASIVVSIVVGLAVNGVVTRRILNSQREAAQQETNAGAAVASDQLAAIASTASTDTIQDTLGTLTDRLLAQRSNAAAAQEGGTYSVLLVAPSPLASRSGRDVDAADVPAGLRSAVAQGNAAYAYTRLHGGAGAPALIVGRPLYAASGTFELYYLFPLTSQQQTLATLRLALLSGGAGLSLLMALIAVLVARQVVRPVRQAAAVAERVSAGDLAARMSTAGEDELARLAESFNDMAATLAEQIEQLRELSRVQQRFVADVSHELRTPLTTVRMAADVLHAARADFPPLTARSAELLQAELDRFESLLVDLLEISRFDAGAAVLDADIVDLDGLTRRVVAALAPLAEHGQCEVVIRPATRDPVLVEADSRRVERIVRNLLANAVEHGECRPVEVTIGADDHAAAIVVRDHGAGLRAGDANRVFSRFWRADPARARRTGGTGLGLSIALEDARLHGGWLEAWGQLGEGAAFRLTLPRHVGTVLRSSPVPLGERSVVRDG
jgi:two-component system sensor histidine kinase MtrB